MNEYDNVKIDVNKLIALAAATQTYRPTALSARVEPWSQQLQATINRYLTGALYASGLWHRLIYANLKLGWFFEFRNYWVNELGLRRLEPHDYFYLSSHYRHRFQEVAVAAGQSNQEFLESWQDPATLYLLFAYQYKLALHPLSAYTLAKYLKPKSNICEYGCGLAPITQSLVNYYPSLNFNVTCADIPSYMLHFLLWKYRDKPYINVQSLDPADDTPLTDFYDAITCMTVFEHLPRPLPVAQHLHKQLRPGGLFMFDYIKSEGKGLDTKQALDDRLEVLEFIRNNFNVIRGFMPTDGRNVRAVLCRKR